MKWIKRIFVLKRVKMCSPQQIPLSNWKKVKAHERMYGARFKWFAIGAISLIVVDVAVATPAVSNCSEMEDGSLVCHQQGYPADGFNVNFSCPAFASSPADCTSCTITAPDGTTPCNGCSMCSDKVVFDCSNVLEGDCVMMDCTGKCYGSSTTISPAPSKPTSSIDTDPVGPEYKSSRKLGILSVAASTIAAFGFF